MIKKTDSDVTKVRGKCPECGKHGLVKLRGEIGCAYCLRDALIDASRVKRK